MALTEEELREHEQCGEFLFGRTPKPTPEEVEGLKVLREQIKAAKQAEGELLDRIAEREEARLLAGRGAEIVAILDFYDVYGAIQAVRRRFVYYADNTVQNLVGRKLNDGSKWWSRWNAGGECKRFKDTAEMQAHLEEHANGSYLTLPIENGLTACSPHHESEPYWKMIQPLGSVKERERKRAERRAGKAARIKDSTENQ